MKLFDCSHDAWEPEYFAVDSAAEHTKSDRRVSPSDNRLRRRAPTAAANEGVGCAGSSPNRVTGRVRKHEIVILITSICRRHCS